MRARDAKVGTIVKPNYIHNSVILEVVEKSPFERPRIVWCKVLFVPWNFVLGDVGGVYRYSVRDLEKVNLPKLEEFL
jgi:hypothetical protein